jgi:hypothetical protein
MEFFVEPEVFARLPGLRLAVVVARDLDNRAQRPAVDHAWATTWAAAAGEASRYGNAVPSARARVAAAPPGNRRLDAALPDVDRGAPPAGHEGRVAVPHQSAGRLLQRGLASPRRPVGGFDLDRVPGPLSVRRTRDGDPSPRSTRTARSRCRPVSSRTPPARRSSRASSCGARSREGLSHPETRSVFLVSESLPEVGPAMAETVLEDLGAGSRGISARP